MKLKQNQIDFYSENGYLVVENLFTHQEIDQLIQEMKGFDTLKHLPQVICETSGEIRSIFAPHKSFNVFDELYRQKRLISPAQQLLGEDVYLYQFKLNNKKAFIGEWWEWHQDFPYWHLDDGIQKPNMLSAMILFQDTTAAQGPLIFLPGSHKVGLVDFEPKQNSSEEGDYMNALGADLKYTVKKELIRDLANSKPLVLAEGSKGTCVFFHPNIFHASSSNMSPFDRNTAIITYNCTSNLPALKTGQRPEYLCARNFEPIHAIQ